MATVPSSSSPTLQELTEIQRSMCAQRNWQVHHTPRNLTLATAAEIGELSRILQWKGDGDDRPMEGAEDKQCVAAELSDVLLNVIRLADVCGIDVSRVTSERLEDLAHRVPPGS